MGDLKAFHYLPHALGAFCQRDGRTRKDIAQAAGINPSMLSGYCSARLTPSLDHLERLLAALGRDAEDLAIEMRTVSQEERSARAALSYETPPEEVPAILALKRLLKEMELIFVAEINELEARQTAASKPSQAKAARRRHGFAD